ncbi:MULTISPECIES: hypothetical protein [unclassified Clostridium]|uniref:hypothetical protein n=1 Tax=unclassified Clostridium TaxID=2614128 RepID=UPI0025C18E58|nr:MULTISPECIES: hypothetical protein [unclassified Clostridium]
MNKISKAHRYIEAFYQKNIKILEELYLSEDLSYQILGNSVANFAITIWKNGI